MERERGGTNHFERFDNLLQYKNLKYDKLPAQEAECDIEKENKNVNLNNTKICASKEGPEISNEVLKCDTELLSESFVQYYHDVLKMLAEKNTEFTNTDISKPENLIDTKEHSVLNKSENSSYHQHQMQLQISHIEHMLEEICQYSKKIYEWLDGYCKIHDAYL